MRLSDYGLAYFANTSRVMNSLGKNIPELEQDSCCWINFFDSGIYIGSIIRRLYTEGARWTVPEDEEVTKESFAKVVAVLEAPLRKNRGAIRWDEPSPTLRRKDESVF